MSIKISPTVLVRVQDLVVALETLAHVVGVEQSHLRGTTETRRTFFLLD